MKNESFNGKDMHKDMQFDMFALKNYWSLAREYEEKYEIYIYKG